MTKSKFYYKFTCGCAVDEFGPFKNACEAKNAAEWFVSNFDGRSIYSGGTPHTYKHTYRIFDRKLATVKRLATVEKKEVVQVKNEARRVMRR